MIDLRKKRRLPAQQAYYIANRYVPELRNLFQKQGITTAIFCPMPYAPDKFPGLDTYGATAPYNVRYPNVTTDDPRQITVLVCNFTKQDIDQALWDIENDESARRRMDKKPVVDVNKMQERLKARRARNAKTL